MRRFANCRPLVPVWARSSGIATWSRLRENRNAGSSGRGELRVRALVHEPGGRALEHRGEELEQVRGRDALAALDHAQVRDRGSQARTALDAARGELLQRQSVALAHRAQLRAEKMTLA